jgi:hypothetical protein
MGSIILRIDALCNQVRQRRRDGNFQSSWGLDCSGVITQHNWHKKTEIFNGLTNLESIQVKVPVVCPVTGRVP